MKKNHEDTREQRAKKKKISVLLHVLRVSMVFIKSTDDIHEL